LRGIEDLRRRLEAVDGALAKRQRKPVTSSKLGLNKELNLAAMQAGLSRNGDITRHVSEAAGRELSISCSPARVADEGARRQHGPSLVSGRPERGGVERIKFQFLSIGPPPNFRPASAICMRIMA
jgi:hypothetical protein